MFLPSLNSVPFANYEKEEKMQEGGIRIER